MDAATIKAQRIVERYLSGDLPAGEARAFEKFCQENPEEIAQLAIPVRVKARLAAKPFEGTKTSVFSAIPTTIERIDTTTAQPIKKQIEVDEPEHQPHVSDSRVGRMLFVLLALALVIIVYLYWQNQGQQTQIKTLTAKAKVLKIRAPSATQTIRITPSETRPVAPQFSISLAEPKLLDIYLDVSTAHFNSYALTIDKTDEARVVIMRRMVADTNKEVRFSLNSSAFGAGDYEFKLEGYNYKGTTSEVGWVMVHME